MRLQYNFTGKRTFNKHWIQTQILIYLRKKHHIQYFHYRRSKYKLITLNENNGVLDKNQVGRWKTCNIRTRYFLFTRMHCIISFTQTICTTYSWQKAVDKIILHSFFPPSTLTFVQLWWQKQANQPIVMHI